MQYYQRFQLVTHLFFFRHLLRWFYRKGMEDVERLGMRPDFSKKDFSCLLCGVSGEITAEEFINFVVNRNKDASVTIIDVGDEQVRSVSKVVKEKFGECKIAVKQMNVLEISKNFKPSSFDWIETDGLIEYLDKPQLSSLLQQWKMTLKEGGFITTRDFASSSKLGSQIDRFRMWIMKNYLTLQGHIHTKKELDKIFAESGFKFVSGRTPVPTFKRYAMSAND